MTCILLRYAGYCPQAKFWHYGDTFGNTTAKCFQERRAAKLNSSVMRQPGTSSDGRNEFPTVYSNTPNLVLAARARTRERWRNAKKYSLFNEHERGREVKDFDQVLLCRYITKLDKNNVKSISSLMHSWVASTSSRFGSCWRSQKLKSTTIVVCNRCISH